jgi:hypothetical protein
MKKLEFLLLASLYSLELCNGLAYWADSYVTKKIKCCEYGPWVEFSTLGVAACMPCSYVALKQNGLA